MTNLPFAVCVLVISQLAPPAHPAPAASAGPRGAAQRSAQQTRPNTRLFGTQDLGRLEAPDREQWQKPDQIMDALSIAEGSRVAELGAAGGWFTLQLAERVGPNGRVYAEDIQRAMLDGISRRMASESLTNVTTVLGTASDPHLPAGRGGEVLLGGFYEMEDPAAPLLGGSPLSETMVI